MHLNIRTLVKTLYLSTSEIKHENFLKTLERFYLTSMFCFEYKSKVKSKVVLIDYAPLIEKLKEKI